jgi:hypothetical protein
VSSRAMNRRCHPGMWGHVPSRCIPRAYGSMYRLASYIGTTANNMGALTLPALRLPCDRDHGLTALFEERTELTGLDLVSDPGIFLEAAGELANAAGARSLAHIASHAVPSESFTPTKQSMRPAASTGPGP